MANKYFNTHNFYLVSLGVKAMDGLLEIAGAIMLLMIDIGNLPGYIGIIFRGELIEDPHDLIANWLIDAISKVDVSVQFAGFLYLVSHGLVKLFLVGSLLKKKYWAYPLSEIVLFLFVVYQTYLFTKNGSTVILFLNAVDLALMVLIWIEYKKLKSHIKPMAAGKS